MDSASALGPRTAASDRPAAVLPWWPFALGLVAMACLVVVLALQLIHVERQRRGQWAVETANALARLASSHIGQIVAEAAADAGLEPRPFTRAQVVQRPNEGWWLELQATDKADPLRIPVDAFHPALALAAMGAEGAATVRTGDLQLVQRHSNAPTAAPPPYGSRTTSAELREAMREQPEGGHFVAVTAIDGIARVNAFQRVAGAPLWVLVGLPERHAPQGPSRYDLPVLALATLTLLVAAVATVWIYRLSLQRMGETQRRYQSIVENSEDAIVSRSPEGRITSWNAAAERMFGWSAQAMVGRSVLEWVPPDRVEEAQSLHDRLLRGERVEGLETERLNQEGVRVPVAVTLSPLRESAQGPVLGFSEIVRDIRRQKQLEAEVLSMALHDPLTQLPNRRLLSERLGQAQRSTQRNGRWDALAYMDLDGFKALNDAHGHDVGDECLVEVAQRLQQAVRDSDTVARMGGDEFVVLWRGVGSTEAEAAEQTAAMALQLEMRLSQPLRLSVGRLRMRASLGWVVFSGTRVEASELLRQADHAMYLVKQAHHQGPSAPALDDPPAGSA